MKENNILKDDSLSSLAGGTAEPIPSHQGEICPNCAFGRLEYSRPRNLFGKAEGLYYCAACGQYFTLPE